MWRLMTTLAGGVASVRLTLLLLALLAGASLLQIYFPQANLAIVALLGLLAVNLLSALIQHRRLHADPLLLGLHLALVGLLLTLLGARLTYWDGQASVTVGAEFEGEVFGVEAGPLYRWGGSLRFANESFSEQSYQGGRYLAGENRIRWVDADGVERLATLRDGEPVQIGRYRVHLAPGRGLALMFSWITPDGQVTLGSVQLPDVKAKTSFKSPRTGGAPPPEFVEAQEWVLPNGDTAWAMLAPVDRVSSDSGGRRLVLHVAGRRVEMVPSESMDVGPYRLTYLGVSPWVGYRIVHDYFAPWILAAGVLAALFMGAYYVRRSPGGERRSPPEAVAIEAARGS